MTSFNTDKKWTRIKISYKIIVFGIILLGFGVYLMEFSTIRLHISTNLDFYNFNNSEKFINREIVDKSYFVSTTGCKIPSLPIMNEQISDFIEKPIPTKCKTAITYSDDQYVWIGLNETELKDMYNVSDVNLLLCFYEPFRRRTDSTTDFYGNIKQVKFGERLKISEEFIRVVCDYDNLDEIYTDFHFFVPNKKRKIQNCERCNFKGNDEKLNVMIIGLDSLSRLNFHRQMNKTVDLILNKLNAIEMLGYNKIGDNTYPNLIPALTGYDTNELASSCLFPENTTYDKCHFIWKTFAKAGFQTAFFEDIGYLGLFNFCRKGFLKQPTDYYIRTLMLEMEKSIATEKKLNVYLCLGGRRPIDVMLEYINKFTSRKINQPSFSFFWSSSMTHDYFNSANLIDDDFSTFLESLSDRNILNKTILFLMSDHGIRWGSFRSTYQGMMEERQPFLSVILPKWFKEKYPEAVGNLNRNRRRLTTHFDLYETLKDLTNPATISTKSIRNRVQTLLEIEPMPRGISLFLPIPTSRTCENSGIESHWCTCHEKQTISTTDIKVQTAARFITKQINEMLLPFSQCQNLFLHSIKEATVGTSNDNITKISSTKHFIDITVRLITKPGGGDFEGTVRMDSQNNTFLTGTISRTNLYGKQSVCIDDYTMKLYCFCR